MSDRRGQPRFEIVGRLRGSVASLEQLTLINLSAGGALIEAPWPLAPESVHSIRLKSGAAMQDVDGTRQARQAHLARRRGTALPRRPGVPLPRERST